MKQFLQAHNLAQVFTPRNQQGKYLKFDASTLADRQEFPGCMKPLEFFSNDIYKNLQEWTVFGERVILYRTIRYWYWFQFENENGFKIVYIARFDNNSWRRWDSWANLTSVEFMGKKWLMQEEQKKKYIPPTDRMRCEVVQPMW